MAQDAPSTALPPPPADQADMDPDTIYIQADTFVHDAENGRYIARGNVEAYARGRIVRAAEVEYYPEADRLIATGGITIVEPDGALEFADNADMTEGLDEAVAVNFSMRLANGAVVTAAYLERSEGHLNLLTRATYSPCPVCEEDPTPTWAIRARKALQDTEGQMIYYRDVTMQVAGVPVFYSPFFAHADPSVDRKTGPLLPRIGYSTLTGFEYEQPFFWAIDDYQDLTVTPRIMSDVAPLLGLNYRKRFWSGYVEFDGTVTKEQMFDSTGERRGGDIWRGSILGGGVFALNENWSWGFGVERVSDPEYLIRYGIYDYDRHGLYYGEQRALVTQLFAAGQDEDFYSSVALAEFQSIYLGDSDRLPRMLPQVEYRRTFDLNDLGRIEAVGDMVFLQREDGVEYVRATTYGDWRRRFVTSPGIVIETLGRARGDFYRVDEAFDRDTLAPRSGSESRLSAYGALDVSWPFFRPGPVALTLEPRAQVVASVGDNHALDGYSTSPTVYSPLLEDSLTVELNGANLFSPERYPGLDLIEEGARLNVGATLRAGWSRGTASLFLGQSFHTDPENFSTASGLSDNASDYILEGQIQSGPVTWRTELRIDPDDYKIERLETNGTFSWGPVTLRANYFKFAEAITGYGQREYVTAFGELRLTDNVAIGGQLGRDLNLGQTRTRSLQARYFDECFSITVAYTQLNYPGTTIGSSESISVSFSLATLGVFGTDTRGFVPVY